jgi:hypothetical protein
MLSAASRAATRAPRLAARRFKHVGTDIEIAQAATMRPIAAIAKERFGIPDEHLEPFGHYKTKVSLDYVDSLADKKDGKLILVTAISPTPAGEGKTLTTVGLGDALNEIGENAVICVREPSLGPVFGIKGGAAGGGYSQVVPMEDINLHFTGDFGAIGLAHNLLSAMLDNHIHHGNDLGIDVRRIQFKRVVDMNDRALRDIVVSLGGISNGRAAAEQRAARARCAARSSPPGPCRPRSQVPAPGRLRHRGGVRGDGHLLPRHVARGPEAPPRQHRRRARAAAPERGAAGRTLPSARRAACPAAARAREE